MDLISKREVIDTLAELQGKAATKGELTGISKVWEKVKNLPCEVIVVNDTAYPNWIPCNERLPEEMGTYMTTIDYGEHGLVTGQRYYYGKGLQWNDECVIAWMPLPEPYAERKQ